MILHLFYKEWLKTRWFVIFSAILVVGAVLYAFIGLNSDIANSGGKASYIHNLFTMGGGVHYNMFKNIPIVIALLVGVSQYYPEVIGKRIKLTLHLPVHATTLLYLMILYGFLVLCAIYATLLILFFAFNLVIFPYEINVMALEAITPWLMSGFVVYFFVAMIAMEPRTKFRFAYFVASCCIVGVFQANSEIISYPIIIVILIVSSLSMLYTSNRFKMGEL